MAGFITWTGMHRWREEHEQEELARGGRPLDPHERRAAEQTTQLDELERKIRAGAISQETAGHLTAIVTSARDWRVKQRAQQLRARAHVQPLTDDARKLYGGNLSRSNPR